MVEKVARAYLRALWFGEIPALLSVLAVRWLVPTSEVAKGTWAAPIAAAGEHPFVFAVAMFALFHLLARYWRDSLPGGRFLGPLSARDACRVPAADRPLYASAAELGQLLGGRRAREHVAKASGASACTELDARLADLGAVLGGSDAERVAATAASLASLGQPWLSRHRRRRWLLLIAPTATAVTLVLVVRAAWVAPYVVADTSMLPSLEPSDVIVETKHPYGWRFGREKTTKPQGGPRRGDVIVFEKPAPVEMVIQRPQGAPPLEKPARVTEVLAQRVIGLPGDRITMRGGIAFINDWQVPICPAAMFAYPLPDGTMVRGQLAVEFLDDRAYLMVYDAGGATWPRAYDVKEGEVFVLGDNRSNNSDSRSFNRAMGGGVSYDLIEGRADRWLFGRRRDERVDLEQSFVPIDLRLRFGGIDGMEIKQGIERCLALRPQKTHPPERNLPNPAAGSAPNSGRGSRG